MLGQAKELLFGISKQSRSSKSKIKNTNEDGPDQSSGRSQALDTAQVQAPPTPKVKKQKLRALNIDSESCERNKFVQTEEENPQAKQVEDSDSRKQRKWSKGASSERKKSDRAAATINSVNSSSVASSGYQSSSAACALPSIESVNQDYSNLLYATETRLDKNGAKLLVLSDNPGKQRLGAPTASSNALLRSGRSLDAGQALTGHQQEDMRTTALSHVETRQGDEEERQLYHGQRHFFTQQQQQPHTMLKARVPPMVPMVPMMIDDDYDNELDEHLCQFVATEHPNDDEADLDQPQSNLIDGRQLRDWSYRQRQAALSLGREAQRRFHLAADQNQFQAMTAFGRPDFSDNDDDEDEICDEELDDSRLSFYYAAGLNQVPFRQLKQNTYANTRRMLITAGQLNKQQQLYKQHQFDYQAQGELDLVLQHQSQQQPPTTKVFYQKQQQFLQPNQQAAECPAFDEINYGFSASRNRRALSSINLEADRAEEFSLEPQSRLPPPRLPPKTPNLTYRPQTLNGMQSSTSKHQLSPSEQQQQQRRSPTHFQQQHSPYHQQQARRSKSGQQQQQVVAAKVNKLNNSNFQFQQNRQQFMVPNETVMEQPRRANNSHRLRQQQKNGSNGSGKLALSCCGKLAKFLLFLTNAMFWLAGISLAVWGILALVDDHKYNLSQLLVFEQGTRMSLFQLLAWSFITLGCATILVGFCGCSAMFKNNRWILGLYIFLILAIFALDLATGLLAIIFQERLVANVRLRLVSKLKNEYGIQASFTAAMDYIQTKYECCGLEGHFDYDQSLWRLQRLGGFEATVARTCCHLRNTFDDQAHVNPRPVNESMCQSSDIRFHQSYRYRRGCLDDLERLIRQKIWTFTIGSGAVGALILLSLMFATCFCRSIPASRNESPNSAMARAQATQQQIASLSYLVEGNQSGSNSNHAATIAAKKQGHSVPQYR